MILAACGGEARYFAALTNFKMIANAVMTTEEVRDEVNGQNASK